MTRQCRFRILEVAVTLLLLATYASAQVRMDIYRYPFHSSVAWSGGKRPAGGKTGPCALFCGPANRGTHVPSTATVGE